MAFGLIAKKRKKRREKRAKREAQAKKLQQEIAASKDTGSAAKELGETEEEVTKLHKEQEPRREEQRKKFQEEAYEDVTKELPGISEKRKQAMQESANRQISNQVQHFARNLGAQSSARGIRGGAAMAPLLSLQEKGLEAQNQFQRDLIERDEERAYKNLANYMASLEGKTAEDLLRRQQDKDYIESKKEKGEQDIWLRYIFKKLFGIDIGEAGA
jgi:hypothetical protein